MAKAQRKEFTFDGLSNNLSETVESERSAWSNHNTWHDRGVLEGIRRYTQIGVRPGSTATDVGFGLGYGKSSGNEIQRVVVTGSPTGGTFKLTFTHAAVTYSAAGTCAYSASATDFYQYLQTLVNTGVYAFRPGDISVTGGPFPGSPMEVEFTGRYANQDVALLVLATNSLTGGSTPNVAISEKRKGGSSEVYYTVVQPSGTGDATLYAVTSTDGFASTTWTSLAADFDPSDWHFEQYQDKMFMANSVDGLKYVYIGSSAISATPPSPPAQAPNYGSPLTDDAAIILGTGCTYASTGFTAPTITTAGEAVRCTLTAAEVGTRTITVTLAADEDLSTNDYGSIQWASDNCKIDASSFKVEFINADGSPVTIKPVAVSAGFSDNGGMNVTTRIQLAGELRYSRDNIDKIKFTFNILDGANTDSFVIFMGMGSNWMNDDLSMVMEYSGAPIKAPIEYMMTYYRVADGVESAPSPSSFSPTLPTNFLGNYIAINGLGSTELLSSDLQWFYRKCRADGTWRRIPNLWTKNGGYQLTDYGVLNDPTGVADGQYDHWMDYELTEFPIYEPLGFPPISTGNTADCLAVWKQCLCVGSGKLAYLSWVGQPLRFEPSPDTPNYVSPDPTDFPNVGETSYVSDNRAEDVKAIVGQDSCYAATNLSVYAKVGDNPAEASVFRRLPGSRGALGRRSVYRYGGGILVGSNDGLWYYSIANNFSGGVGQLVEREETGGNPGAGGGVRRSYQRLLSAVQCIQFTGTVDSGSFTLTHGGNTTVPIAFDASPLTIRIALSALYNVNPGDIEVFGDDLPLGKVYIRFLGQYAGTAVSALTYTSSLGGDNPGISISTITAGSTANVCVLEFNDEYWLFNGRNYLHQSRSRKWSEGILGHGVVAAFANRERGLVYLSSTGRLMRFGEGVTQDAGETVYWQHESPWMTGARARIIEVKAQTLGRPNLRIYSDDGAGGMRTKDIQFDESRFTVLKSVLLPGVRHKLIFSGIVGLDAVEKFTLSVQGDSDEHGS